MIDMSQLDYIIPRIKYNLFLGGIKNMEQTNDIIYTAKKALLIFSDYLLLNDDDTEGKLALYDIAGGYIRYLNNLGLELIYVKLEDAIKLKNKENEELYREIILDILEYMAGEIEERYVVNQ